MIGFDYRAPDSLDAVTAALDELGDDARLIAGGTALVILMKQRLVQPAVLVSLRRLTALREIALENGNLRIGATASHRQIENNPLVQEHLPVLGRPFVASRHHGSATRAPSAGTWSTPTPTRTHPQP